MRKGPTPRWGCRHGCLSPAAFFRGVSPTSPLAVLPYPVLWGVSSPSGGRAAPPQPLLRCALAAPVAGGVVASRVPCGHPASGGVAGALFPSASTLPSLPFDPHRHHLSRHMSKAAGCDAAQAQRMRNTGTVIAPPFGNGAIAADSHTTSHNRPEREWRARDGVCPDNGESQASRRRPR